MKPRLPAEGRGYPEAVTSRTRFLLSALLLSVVMALVSALPTGTKHALHTQGFLHPWLHVAGFALLAYLLLGAVRFKSVRLLLVAALVLFAYGTEAGESRADGWPIERKDVEIDLAGIALGSVSALLRSRLLARHEEAPHAS